jgi:hypothetical protein
MSALPINVWRACDAPKQPTSFMEYGEVMAAFDEMDEPEVADKVRQKAFVDFSRAVVKRTKPFKGPEREPVWEYDLVDSAKEELGLFLNVDPPNTETDSLAILNIIRQEAMNFGLVVFAESNEFGFLSDGTVHSSSETIEPARADAYFEEKINQAKQAKAKAPKKQSLKQFAKQAFAKIAPRMEALGFVIKLSYSDTRRESITLMKTKDQHQIRFTVNISTMFSREYTRRSIEADGDYIRLEQNHPSMYRPDLEGHAGLSLLSSSLYQDETSLETDHGTFVIDTPESLQAATDILLGPFLSIFEAIKTPVDLNWNAFNINTDNKLCFRTSRAAFVATSWLLRNPHYLEHLLDRQTRKLSYFGICSEWLLDQLALDNRPQVPEADLDHNSRLNSEQRQAANDHFKTNSESLIPLMARLGYAELPADPTEPFVKRWTRSRGDIRIEFIAYSIYAGLLGPQMACVCIFYSNSFLEASKKIGLGDLGSIVGASSPPFYSDEGNVVFFESAVLSNCPEVLNKPLKSINKSALDRLDEITDLSGVAQVLNRIKEDEYYPGNRFPFSWRHVLLAHLTGHPTIDQYKALWPTVACSGAKTYFFNPNDPSRPRDSGFKGGISANRITAVLEAIKNGVI